MRRFGSPRDWPPKAEEELARLLSQRARRLTFDTAQDADPDLQVALSELEVWLVDPRKYDPSHHKWPWQSLAADVRHAVSACGPRLRSTTPHLTLLDRELDGPALGADEEA